MASTKLKTEASFMASIRIFGTGLDFERISRTLNLSASKTHRAGDHGLTSKPYAQDLWCIDSPLPRTEPLDAHLLWLRQALEPRYEFLHSLRGNAVVRSFCGIIAEEECSFRLSANAVAICVDLGIDLELSLIFLSNECSGASSEPEKDQNGSPESESDTYRVESHVLLSLRGEKLDLNDISFNLGVNSSDFHLTADSSPLKTPSHHETWSLPVPLDLKVELDSHLRWLGDFLFRHAEFLSSLRHHADILIHCDFDTESDNGGIGLSPEALRAPVKLGLPLEFRVRLI